MTPPRTTTVREAVPQSETREGLSQLLLNLSNLDVKTVFRVLKASEEGLTDYQVALRVAKYGKNEVAHERPLPWYRMLLGNFKNPFVLVLLVIGTVSYMTGDMKATAIVSVMVGLSVLVPVMWLTGIIVAIGLVPALFAVGQECRDAGATAQLFRLAGGDLISLWNADPLGEGSVRPTIS